MSPFILELLLLNLPLRESPLSPSCLSFPLLSLFYIPHFTHKPMNFRGILSLYYFTHIWDANLGIRDSSALTGHIWPYFYFAGTPQIYLNSASSPTLKKDSWLIIFWTKNCINSTHWFLTIRDVKLYKWL